MPTITCFYILPLLTHTCTLTEAVVLYDYEKQEDDELSLKVGDVITEVKQVCAVNGHVCIQVESCNTLLHFSPVLLVGVTLEEVRS